MPSIPRAIAAVTLLVALSGNALALQKSTNSPRKSHQHKSVEPAANSILDELSNVFERIAREIKPSVVSVVSSKRVQSTPWDAGPSQKDLFEDFFGHRFFDRFTQPDPPAQDYVQQGLGTGFIVSTDGHILTNYHVVRDADEISVKLMAGRSYKARVVGEDPKTDLAVLKIPASDDLVPATLGSSSDLRAGHWVAAIGNPFGLTATITAGIVSAVGRNQVGIADYEDLIQTDAAINPGNSGGPLMNLRGEVVGVNTALLTKTGGYMGIGLAIPIDMAKSIKDSLISHGRVIRGWLGINIQDLTEGLATSFGFEGTEGVIVADVVEGGPAEEAGLQRGDIITRIMEKPVGQVSALRLLVARLAPGSKVSLEVFRSAKHKTLEVTIGELPEDHQAADKPPLTSDMGLVVQTLTPSIAKSLGHEDQLQGVVVTKVVPLGAAARAGLRVRDVILAVDEEPVRNKVDFDRALSNRKLEAGARLDIRRGRARLFVFLQRP